MGIIIHGVCVNRVCGEREARINYLTDSIDSVRYSSYLEDDWGPCAGAGLSAVNTIGIPIA